jgi:DNA modification methylase
VTYELHLGDCRDVMAAMPEASIDSIVTDPPYEIGIVGQAWDRTGVAFDVRTWREALRVAKPGAHLAAFGGTRTFHRLTCAIEDAGWEIVDSIDWLFGSGRPTGKNLGDGRHTRLKPGHEPICVARAPVSGALGSGVGGFFADAATAWSGRFPANVVLTHGDGCAPAGTRSLLTRGGYEGSRESSAFTRGMGTRGPDHKTGIGERVPGTKYMLRETVEAWSCAEGCPIAAIDAQADAAHRFFFCSKPSKAERGEGNDWRTVKPLALMRWLCRLVTPPGGRILDPFHGSGSTLLAALAEGRDVEGIDKDPRARAIAQRRLDDAGPLFAGRTGT